MYLLFASLTNKLLLAFRFPFFPALKGHSSELSATPANIPPFDFSVNDNQWIVPKNRQPPWSKSTVDQADILSQITKLEKHNIVEKSNAAYYSQVLLVPK